MNSFTAHTSSPCQHTHTQAHSHTHTQRAIKSPKTMSSVRTAASASSSSSSAAPAAAARHEVYLLKLISFELSTGNNAKIIHRHHQYNQAKPPAGCCAAQPELGPPKPNCLRVSVVLLTWLTVCALGFAGFDFWQRAQRFLAAN